MLGGGGIQERGRCVTTRARETVWPESRNSRRRHQTQCQHRTEGGELATTKKASPRDSKDTTPQDREPAERRTWLGERGQRSAESGSDAPSRDLRCLCWTGGDQTTTRLTAFSRANTRPLSSASHHDPRMHLRAEQVHTAQLPPPLFRDSRPIDHNWGAQQKSREPCPSLDSPKDWGEA